MGVRHEVGTADGGVVTRRRQRRALTGALALNAVFLVVEAVGGLVFNSLALLADAAHMLSDVAALAIALIAQRLIERPPTGRHTFGLQRAEVLAAQANGIILLAASLWIVVEAVGRLGAAPEVRGGGLLAVATAGLLVNLGAAAWLHRVEAGSLNVRGALTHLLADAVGSLAAMAAGAAVLLGGADWVDPAMSLLVAALVLVAAFRLLRDATHVLLEGTPRGVSLQEVERALVAHPEVEAVHHVHVWSLASDVLSLSGHVVLRDDQSLHRAQMIGDELRRMLDERFAIRHATLELECHLCDEVPAPPSR